MTGWRTPLLTVMSVALAVGLVHEARGQSFNGAITGVVQDSSGAVVPETALTLRNVATDQTVATAVSGTEGEYAFRNLAPAKYEVTAVKTGFQQVVLSNVVVPLSTQVRLDVTLSIGALGEIAWRSRVRRRC